MGAFTKILRVQPDYTCKATNALYEQNEIILCWKTEKRLQQNNSETSIRPLNYSVHNFRKILHTGLQINIIHLLNWIAVTKQIDCRALTESFLRKTIQPCRNAHRSCQQLHTVKKSKTRTVHLWKYTLWWKQLAKVSFLLTQRPRLQQPI